jgi:hypothetical protein
MIPFSVEWESKLWELREDAAARDAFLKDTGCTSALPKIIVQGYKVVVGLAGRGSGAWGAPGALPRTQDDRRAAARLPCQPVRTIAGCLFLAPRPFSCLLRRHR